ncbi:MAG: type VI secretion system contractile sheath small subunit [Burkholderiaceae bacterium]|jgi:type VI secretion system protein ImpB|nr:type VI secretion system contractile sheath small subunit [Burkholderiaceae bacterium]
MASTKTQSVQKRLQKVRPPRVQLTYDVEIGDAVEKKELPFVVGVVADLAGQTNVELPKLKDRKFVNIDRDNIDDVMEGLKPRAAFQAPNKLDEGGGKLAVDLTFTSMESFSPEAVVEQVEPLKKLLEVRSKLADLRNKMAGNEKLEDTLAEVLSNTEKLHSLGQNTPSDKDET